MHRSIVALLSSGWVASAHDVSVDGLVLLQQATTLKLTNKVASEGQSGELSMSDDELWTKLVPHTGRAGSKALTAKRKHCERLLAEQADQSNPVAATNKGLRQEITGLKKGRQGLKQELSELQRGNHLLRATLMSMSTNLGRAHKFARDSIKDSNEVKQHDAKGHGAAPDIEVLKASSVAPGSRDFGPAFKDPNITQCAVDTGFVQTRNSSFVIPHQIAQMLAERSAGLKDAQGKGEPKLKTMFLRTYRDMKQMQGNLVKEQSCLFDAKSLLEKGRSDQIVHKEQLQSMRLELARRLHDIQTFLRKLDNLVADSEVEAELQESEAPTQEQANSAAPM